MYFSFCFAVISAQQSKFITYGIGKENKTLIEDRLKKKKRKQNKNQTLYFMQHTGLIQQYFVSWDVEERGKTGHFLHVYSHWT